ncbi:hypothetical protein T4D_12101 [Trichinella pseudospiralis]|uniref:Uncharacterized protein n=1 Tax=Trichinella pseudospiralis TaxID=6337 RepID=A0A0V1FN38_TRIPS|nr:hypothetical protein T4D_12101 [Trichinella pseudospiralis]
MITTDHDSKQHQLPCATTASKQLIFSVLVVQGFSLIGLVLCSIGLRVFLPDVVNGRRSGKAELIMNHDAVSFGYNLKIKYGSAEARGSPGLCAAACLPRKRVGGCKVNSDGDNPDEKNKAVAEPSAETADLLHVIGIY